MSPTVPNIDPPRFPAEVLAAVIGILRTPNLHSVSISLSGLMGQSIVSLSDQEIEEIASYGLALPEPAVVAAKNFMTNDPLVSYRGYAIHTQGETQVHIVAGNGVDVYLSQQEMLAMSIHVLPYRVSLDKLSYRSRICTEDRPSAHGQDTPLVRHIKH